jgi:pimeloyl-ACP methyl ester carboxylesterase
LCVATLAMLGSLRSGAQQLKLVPLPCTAKFGKFDEQTRDIARCGTLTVPQDRKSPGDAKLQDVVLPVIVYAAPTAHGTPILFLAGGPGESAIDASQQALFQTALGQMLLRERPVITFDRRGSLSDDHRASPDLGSVDYQAKFPKAQALTPLRDTLSRLAKSFHSQGVDFQNFTTLAAVEDITDVIRALGYPKVILYGASYGTRDALQFARRHPDMIESLVLDGLAPPNATTLLDSATIVNAGRAVVSRIVEDCRHDESCAAEFADLERAVDWLSADTTGHVRRTANFPDNGGWHTLEARGSAILSVIGMASTWEAIRAEAPKVLVEFASQDTVRTALAARVLVAAAADPTLTGGHGERVPLVRFIGFCGDRPQGEPFGGDRKVCDAMDVPFSGPEAIERVTSDLPALLLSSGYDAQTPAYFAEDAARTLSHSHRVLFPMVGHVASVRPVASACAAVVIESFIAQPAKAPATSCVSSVVPAFAPRGFSQAQKAP